MSEANPAINTKGDFMQVITVIAFVVFQTTLIEALGYHFIYRHDEYKDLIESTKNLGKKIKQLKDQQLYGKSVKSRQNEKMIKVQEDKYRDYHRQLSMVSSESGDSS